MSDEPHNLPLEEQAVLAALALLLKQHGIGPVRVVLPLRINRDLSATASARLVIVS